MIFGSFERLFNSYVLFFLHTHIAFSLLILFFFVVESFDEESKQILESIAKECKEYYGSVGKLHQNQMEQDAALNFRNLSPCTEFSGNTPVDLRGLKETSLARFVNYVQSDLRNLKRLLSELPVNRASMVSEITADLDLWGRFFKDPPPEVARLMKGLASLRKAYNKGTPDLAAGIALQKEQIQQRASVVKTFVDKVSISCSSMDELRHLLWGSSRSKRVDNRIIYLTPQQ